METTYEFILRLKHAQCWEGCKCLFPQAETLDRYFLAYELMLQLEPDKKRGYQSRLLADTRDGLPLQRLLTPVMTANRQGNPLVSSCSLFDVGIKLSYAISSYIPPRRKSHAAAPARDEAVLWIARSRRIIPIVATLFGKHLHKQAE